MKLRFFKNSICLILVSNLLVFCNGTKESKVTNNEKSLSECVDFVDPFIGTSALGNTKIGTTSGGSTHPGAVRPFGMVSVNPHTDKISPSGYYYGKPHMYGFGHVHISGTGCNDLGNIVLMPTTGKIQTSLENYKSAFKNEKASPGYYKMDLIDHNITAEMSSTVRTGISKYTFHKGSDSSNILIDLTQGILPKLVTMPSQEGSVKIISDTEVEGYNYSGDFCYGKSFHAVYFVARFSKPAFRYGTWKDQVVSNKTESSGKNFGAFFNFKTKDEEAIYVRVGISYVSIKNARENLDAEQGVSPFEKIVEDARAEWEKELSKIKVEGATEKEKKIFYTGLYHMLQHPNVFSDVNGEYQAMREPNIFVNNIFTESKERNSIKKAEGYTRYTVFSLWDTYRNLHPLFSLVYPERQVDMVKSLIGMYEESGKLPKWELAGGETNTMVGNPAVPVIADAYIKGIHDFNIDKAFEAMKVTASRVDNFKSLPGLKSYLKYGYIPMDNKREWVWGAVSTTLEYNYADWCLSQFAKATGKDDDYKMFYKRSMFYKNLYDSSSTFIRPKNQDGSWYTPFKPDTMEGGDNDFPGAGGPGFVEGNAWHYNFFVPHDIDGLKKLMGGDKNFTNKLVETFEKKKYSLSNEPDMDYPFLFDYVDGEGWRTQQEVRKQMVSNFDTSPQGIPGNDDCGVLSGFYVFGAMGFYPACPASNAYQICSPIFDKITIQLNNKYYKGGKFVIEAKNNSPENIFIQSAELDGKPYSMQTLFHEDIVKGGTLTFVMSNSPKRK